MGIKTTVIKTFSRSISKSIVKWRKSPIQSQHATYSELMKGLADTKYGRDHRVDKAMPYREFADAVPISDYEGFHPYIDQIIEGKSNILWPGKPIYFAKTSGTTSGSKYIPISRESIKNHINTARDALLNYVYTQRAFELFNGKMIFLSGSPVLERAGSVKTGRLSGIVNHHVPSWIKGNQLPSYDTNCIEDWELKLDKIIEETLGQNMTLISGIPPWVVMYYERLQEKTGKPIMDIFPNYRLFIHGGVNFEPYKDKLVSLVGKQIDTLETYPASEGFIAFQDSMEDEGMLLNVKSGIFFEFIPVSSIHDEKPKRLSLEEVELNQNYVIIINNNAGLWGYNIGDTIKFTSLNPYRLKVTGRIKHFISAFGEHVIAEEIESSLSEAAQQDSVSVIEFTVAPMVNPSAGLPYHEWFIEFESYPKDLDAFRLRLDGVLRAKNSYYKDLIDGSILQPLRITPIKKDGFRDYMKSKGKLGGQNKLPRLSNDRSLVAELEAYIINDR